MTCKMAMGMENGRLDFVLFSGAHAGLDFDRVEQLDPGNVAATAFDLALEMMNAQILDPASAPELAFEVLHFGLTLGDPDVIEPINVGTILSATGMTINYPLSSGVPQATLQREHDPCSVRTTGAGVSPRFYVRAIGHA